MSSAQVLLGVQGTLHACGGTRGTVEIVSILWDRLRLSGVPCGFFYAATIVAHIPVTPPQFIPLFGPVTFCIRSLTIYLFRQAGRWDGNGGGGVGKCWSTLTLDPGTHGRPDKRMRTSAHLTASTRPCSADRHMTLLAPQRGHHLVWMNISSPHACFIPPRLVGWWADLACVKALVQRLGFRSILLPFAHLRPV